MPTGCLPGPELGAFTFIRVGFLRLMAKPHLTDEDTEVWRGEVTYTCDTAGLWLSPNWYPGLSQFSLWGEIRNVHSCL